MRFIRIAVTAAALGLCVTIQVNASGFKNSDFKGVYAFRLWGATSFAPFYDGTAGKTNSGIATAPRQDVLRVGVFKSDGKGNLTGHAIATTDDGVSTVVIDYNWTGTYSMSTNGDGTGTMIINAASAPDINLCQTGDGTPVSGCEAFEGAQTYALAITGTKKQRAVTFIETDNASGGAKIFLQGSATFQDGKGSSGGGFNFPF
jgi:hypothetical protein